MSEPLSGCVEIGESVLYQTVGDEIVLLNMTNQEYFGLDRVAADVWQLLVEHRNIETVTRLLAAIYAIDEQTARADIEPLVAELLSANLLTQKPSMDV